MDSRATDKIFKTDTYGKWIGVDNTGVKQFHRHQVDHARVQHSKHWSLPTANKPAFSYVAVELS